MLNIKFCVVLETEDGIISSSHDGWGMTKYHVQGCMALCTASLFFQVWMQLLLVCGITKEPHSLLTQRPLVLHSHVLLKKIRTSPTLELNQRLQITLCKQLVLVPKKIQIFTLTLSEKIECLKTHLKENVTFIILLAETCKMEQHK